MSENETQADQAEPSASPNLIPPEFSAMGQKRLDELVAAQTHQFEKLAEIGRNWFERMQSEAALASELATKLTAARSVPEVATAYQEWGTRQMERAAEDAKRVFSEAQKLAESGAQLLSKSLQTNGQGKSV
jgi:Phasin protein